MQPGSGIGFSEARNRAPAIIVIDEMDMTGHRRSGSGAVIADDEREQTLNLLLAEMDGFDVTPGDCRARRDLPSRGPRPGAAASRPLRPAGRDPAARADGAAAILAVHC